MSSISRIKKIGVAPRFPLASHRTVRYMCVTGNGYRMTTVAKMIYLADLPSGEVVMSVDKAHYDQGWNKLPRIYSEATGWVRCTRVVQRKNMPSMHECDARCMNATGRTMQCECSCGGKNHGKGRIVCEAA